MSRRLSWSYGRNVLVRMTDSPTRRGGPAGQYRHTLLVCVKHLLECGECRFARGDLA
jgi:hypothetical protein